MKFPEECEILRLYKDQISSCYINPIEHCPHFRMCLDYLYHRIMEEKQSLRETDL